MCMLCRDAPRVAITPLWRLGLFVFRFLYTILLLLFAGTYVAQDHASYWQTSLCVRLVSVPAPPPEEKV